MKKILILIILFGLAAPSQAQNRQQHSRPHPGDGFYILLGDTRGPSFSNFFDYLINTYHPPKPLKEFKNNVSFNIGYISRFHRNFAIDIGFSIYALHSKGDFPNPNSTDPNDRFRHELDYQAAIFTGTLPILFEFSPTQPVIPYVGIGLSIYSMRLDHFRDSYSGGAIQSFAQRDTRTAVGGHFEVGIDVKITGRIWLDLRGRWHDGTGHLSTLEDNFHDFSIKQNISQLSAGIDYFFR
jgi:opacity protein-like surface antigen